MKSIAILASATGLVCSLAAINALTAWADDQLKGKYAFTENQQCLFAAGGGFNAILQPNNPARSVLGSNAHAGTYTFDGDGGLTVDEITHVISTPAYSGNPTLPSTHSETGTGSGDYKFAADGSVTLTFAITAAKILSGPNAGLTFSIDKFVLSGQLSTDNKTLLLSATEPVVSTVTFPNSTTFPQGLVIPLICNFSGTAVRVGP